MNVQIFFLILFVPVFIDFLSIESDFESGETRIQMFLARLMVLRVITKVPPTYRVT